MLVRPTTLDQVGRGFHDLVFTMSDGLRTMSELLAQLRFALTYNSVQPRTPSCLPLAS